MSTNNIKSGITVSLIAIPLSIALSTASGGTPLQGILTGIYACAIAGLTGGSRYNIFGPAGALTALLSVFVLQRGANPLLLPLLSITVGIIIALVYFLKIGNNLTLIPSTALHGFIAGVGLTIITGQLNTILGIGHLVTKHSETLTNLKETALYIGQSNSISIYGFVISFVLLWLRSKYIPQIPAAVPLTISGVLFGLRASHYGYMDQRHLASLQSTYSTISFQLGDFSFIGWLMDSWQTLGSEFWFSLFETSCVIAVIAILETIISAKIADNFTGTKHDTQKEIRGLALANIGSGLLGGIPATGVFVRTALNIKSGASSQWSAVIAGGSVAIISLALFRYFTFIPMVVIAAILVSIALKLLDTRVWKKMFHYDKKSLRVLLLVAMITWLSDPMYGIIVGTSIALLIHIVHLTHESLVITIMRDGKFYKKTTISDYVSEQIADDQMIVKLAGEINFMNITCLIEQLELLHKENTLIISCRSVTDMDIDAIEQLEHFIDRQLQANRDIRLCSLSPHLTSQLCTTLMYQSLEANNAIYGSTASAIL